MSEVPQSDAKREINEAEIAYFIEALERLESLLESQDSSGEYETPAERLMDGSVFATKAQAAVFAVEDTWVEVERCTTYLRTPEDEKTESITWNARIYHIAEAGEKETPGLIDMDSFSVMSENGRSGYPTYQKHYIATDPETGMGHQMPPAELPDDLESDLEVEDDLRRRIEILMEALDQQEAIRVEMEELTGIDDGRLFTPERMYEAIELLQQIRPQHRQIDPYL